MADPHQTNNPSLHDVMREIVSAMSALNMPDPRHCPPDMVEHAYEHLDAAARMLTQTLQQLKGGMIEALDALKGE